MNGVSFGKGTSLDLHAQNEPFVRTYCGKGKGTLAWVYNECKAVHGELLIRLILGRCSLFFLKTSDFH